MAKKDMLGVYQTPVVASYFVQCLVFKIKITYLLTSNLIKILLMYALNYLNR